MSLIAEAAGKLVATDRAKALAKGDQFSGEVLRLFQFNFAQSWAHYDLQGALQWVETHGDDISSMVNKIRGAANKTLSLRVESKDGGTLRNITLTREQLMIQEE